MRIDTALLDLLCRSVNHVLNMVRLPQEKHQPVSIVSELIQFAYGADMPELMYEVPVTKCELDEYAKRIAFSLVVEKAVIEVGSDDVEITKIFKMIIPQLVQDLWIDAEILEARFEVV